MGMRIVIYLLSCLVSSIIGGVLVTVWFNSGLGSLDVQKITISDDEGRVRATLGMARNGTAGLAFMNEEEKPKLLLGTGPDGVPWLFMVGATKKPVLAMITTDNEPAIYFYHDSQPGQPRIGISIIDEQPGLTIFDVDGEAVWNTVD